MTGSGCGNAKILAALRVPVAESPFLNPPLSCLLWAVVEPSRSTFQNSTNPIGQYIIHDYMRICAIALTRPLINPNPTLINPNSTNQIGRILGIPALKRTPIL